MADDFVLSIVVTCLVAIVSRIAVSLPSKRREGALGVAVVKVTSLWGVVDLCDMVTALIGGIPGYHCSN